MSMTGIARTTPSAALTLTFLTLVWTATTTPLFALLVRTPFMSRTLCVTSALTNASFAQTHLLAITVREGISTLNMQMKNISVIYVSILTLLIRYAFLVKFRDNVKLVSTPYMSKIGKYLKLTQQLKVTSSII
jgi:hypothetical protein